MRGLSHASSHIGRLLSELPAFAHFVTVIDGHPATLSWLGGVRGDRVTSPGVEHFGQSGRIADLCAHHGMDTKAVRALVAGKPVRHLRAV